jgi:hypothetical protein
MRSSFAIVLLCWLLFVALLASVHVWATPVLTAEPSPAGVSEHRGR